jgi:uncharacterized protein (DUF427 family)
MKLTVNEKPAGTRIASGEDGREVDVFEGNWYFDPAVVDMSHLKVTQRTYTCPYKGTCYWIDLESPTGRAQNIAWVYNNPNPGYEHIKDRIAFYARDTAGTTAKRGD